MSLQLKMGYGLRSNTSRERRWLKVILEYPQADNSGVKQCSVQTQTLSSVDRAVYLKIVMFTGKYKGRLLHHKSAKFKMLGKYLLPFKKTFIENSSRIALLFFLEFTLLSIRSFISCQDPFPAESWQETDWRIDMEKH